MNRCFQIPLDMRAVQTDKTVKIGLCQFANVPSQHDQVMKH